MPFNWCVYIAQCSDSTYYTGITNNLTKRIATHNAGVGAKYTKMRLPVKLVYFETAANRSTASQREYELKQLTRSQKQALISSNTVYT